MKPSEALDTIGLLTSETTRAERRARNMREDLSRLLADLDAGHALSDLGERARHLLGADRDDATADELALFAGIVMETPLRKDGQPRQKPGRKPKAEPAAIGSPHSETEQAKAPVDEAKNAIDIKAIRSALEGGPLTVGELVMNSGVSRTDVLRHLAAGAVIEEYTGARGDGLDPLPLVRLISQRPS